MAYSRLTMLVAALFLVGSGIPTSPQAPTSKFSKYEKPAQIQQIDWLVLQTNLQVIKSWVDNPLAFIDTPVVTFNHKTQRIEAFTNVNADELSKLPIGEVKGRLQVAAIYTGTAIQLFMEDFDDLNGRDFYMVFRGLSIQGARKNLPISVFAEFQNAQVTLH